MAEQTDLSRLVAARVEGENAVRTKLNEFADALYGALEMPRLRGQIGFRPRTGILPTTGLRGSREHR